MDVQNKYIYLFMQESYIAVGKFFCESMKFLSGLNFSDFYFCAQMTTPLIYLLNMWTVNTRAVQYPDIHFETTVPGSHVDLPIAPPINVYIVAELTS